MASPSLSALLGYESLDECLGKPIAWTLYFNPEKRAEFLGILQKKGSVANYEVVLKRRDGAPVIVETSSHYYYNDSGVVAGVEGIFRDVTERKKTESQREAALEALRLSEQQMKAIVDGSPIPQFVIDKNHQITHWNRALEEYSGIRAEDVMGTNQQWRAFYGKERPCMADLIVDGAIDSIPQWYAGKYSHSRLLENAYEATDFFNEMKGGTWLHFTAAPIRDAVGNIIGAVETLADISELIRSEKDLAASHHQLERHSLFLEALLSTMPVPVFYKDADGRYLGCNSIYSEIMGTDPNEIKGKTVFDLLPCELAEDYHRRDMELLQNPGIQVYESKIRNKNGEIRDVIFRKSVFKNEDGAIGGILGAYFDITERKRSEEELKFRNLILSTQMETSMDGILVIGEAGGILSFNEKFKDMWGLPPEVLAAKSNDMTIQAAQEKVADSAHFVEKVRELYRHHDLCSFDEITMKDGRVFERYSAPMIGTGGIYQGRVWYFRDITNRRAVEKALRESEGKYRDLAELLPQAVFECDLEGRVSFANQRALHDFGYSPNDISRGLHMVDMAHPEDRARIQENFHAILDGAMLEGIEYRLLRKDGTSFEALSYSTPIIRDRVKAGLRGVMINISERKKAEKERKQIQTQLIHAQKMNAIGTLSSGIAHDFNNMLGGIMGSLSLLELLLGKETLEQREAIFEYLSTAMEASNRATDLVRQLLTISRKDEFLHVPVDLAVSLKHVLQICRNSLPKSVELDFSLPDQHCRVLADPTRIEQVFLNMCVNASHAMTIMRTSGEKHGGTLSVAAGEFTSDSHFTALHSEAEAGKKYIKVDIRDTGVGMDQATQARIFEPFFSTKKKEEGTGLGLSVAYGIIRQLGGLIRVYSAKGRGSIFSVYLPVLVREEHAASVPETHAIAPLQSACILLIDDEKALLRVAEGILSVYGYTVFKASSGDDGISLFKQHRATINMVLLDLSLPRMSGFEIFEALRIIDPSVRVVLCSGFAEDERIKAAIEAGAAGFLQKPYTASSLLETISLHAHA